MKQLTDKEIVNKSCEVYPFMETIKEIGFDNGIGEKQQAFERGARYAREAMQGNESLVHDSEIVQKAKEYLSNASLRNIPNDYYEVVDRIQQMSRDGKLKTYICNDGVRLLYDFIRQYGNIVVYKYIIEQQSKTK
jgi:hypothetical protein